MGASGRGQFGVRAESVCRKHICPSGLADARPGSGQPYGRYLRRCPVRADKGGKRLATFGVVTRKLLKAFDIDNEVYYADLNWKELMKAIRNVKVNYTEISKFPAVKRDLALLIDKKVQFAEIEKIAYETEKKLLKEVSLFDVYEAQEPGSRQEIVCRKFPVAGRECHTERQAD